MVDNPENPDSIELDTVTTELLQRVLLSATSHPKTQVEELLAQDNPILSNALPVSKDYIDDDTILVIPPNFLRRYPFFLVAKGGDTIKLSELKKLSKKDIEEAFNMLQGHISIINNEIQLLISKDERINIPGGRGSIREYLLPTHLTTLRELKQ